MSLSVFQLNELEHQLWINPGLVIDDPNKEVLADQLLGTPDNEHLIDHLLTTYFRKPNLIWLTHHQLFEELDIQAWYQRIRRIFPKLGLGERQIFVEVILILWVTENIESIKSTDFNETRECFIRPTIHLLNLLAYPAVYSVIDDLIKRLTLPLDELDHLVHQAIRASYEGVGDQFLEHIALHPDLWFVEEFIIKPWA